MGYYTQHIIEIVPESDATQSNYRRVAEAICAETEEDYTFCIHDGIMDDSLLNGTDGTKWYQDECIREISERVPDLTLEISYIGETYVFEDDAAGIVTIKNGDVIDTADIDTERFYRLYAYVPGTYEISDEPEGTEHKGTGTKIKDLYRHDRREEDDDEEF